MFSVKDIVLKSLLSAKTDLQKEYEEVGPTLFQDIFVSTVIWSKGEVPVQLLHASWLRYPYWC